MISIETEHLKLNRILLLAVGLWPYYQSKLVRLQSSLLSSILISFIVFQLTVFLTRECTLDRIIKTLSTAIFMSLLLITYNSFWINIDIIRRSLDQLKHVCKELKDENEIAVMKRYGSNVKRFTLIITLITVGTLFTVIVLSSWPYFSISPINESRSMILMKVTEYFFDQERYFYLILLHENVAICIGVAAFIATGTMLVGCFTYACGMFRIASYRIRQAIPFTELGDSLKNEIMICKGIIYAVDIHRIAMKYSGFLITNFEGSFFFIIIFIVTCLSLNLFGLFQFVLYGDDVVECLVHFMIVNVLLSYTFVANYIAQNIIDHNNHIFATVYDVQWYMTPLSTQKIILFILQRGTKAFNLNVGGLFIGSLESAAMMMSASISYFTVLYSTRQ